MLIDSSINPDKSLYVLWGELIRLIERIKKKEKIIWLEVLYNLFIDIKTEYHITLDYFIYILDWLYLLELIDIDNNNNIKICF